MVFLNGYKYRKKLTIQNSKVSGSSPHVNFPVYIQHILDTDLKSVNVQSLGQDIRFTAVDEITVLDFEIDEFTNNVTNGTLHAFVKLPSLSNSIDTVIYLYYGNPTANDGQNKNAVWDNNYKLVYHLKEPSGGTDAIKDATSNNNHGTTSPTIFFEKPGKIGKSVEFQSGASNKITSKNNIGISGDSARTFEYWVDRFGALNTDAMIAIGANSINNLFAALFLPNAYLNGIGAGNDWITGFPGTVNLDYHFITHVNGQTEWYINGVRIGTGNAHVFNTTDTPAVIGNKSDDSAAMGGIMDEVRISDTARSADWGITNYNNQNDPNTFMTTGIQELELILGITKTNVIRNIIKTKL